MTYSYYKPTYQAPKKLYKGHPTYYLAYGSNLNVLQMQKRCKTAVPISPATLNDHRLVFTVVATIEPSPGDSVPCAVWKVTTEDIAALDNYEGFPDLYDKKFVTLDLKGEKVAAFTYFIDIPYDEEMPSFSYLATITEGYQEWQLDDAKLTEALQAAEAAEDAADNIETECAWCDQKFPRSEMIRLYRHTDQWLCIDCEDLARHRPASYSHYGSLNSDDAYWEGRPLYGGNDEFAWDELPDPYDEAIEAQLDSDDSENSDDPWWMYDYEPPKPALKTVDGDYFDPTELDWTPHRDAVNH